MTNIYVKRTGKTGVLFTRDKIYEVTEEGGGYFIIINDQGNRSSIGKDSSLWEVMHTESRHAEVGESVLVVNPDRVSVRENMDMRVFTTEKVFGSAGIRVSGKETGLEHGEYVVIVDENQTKTQTLEEVKMTNIVAGNVVVSLRSNLDLTAGKAYVVRDVIGDAEIQLRDDEGDMRKLSVDGFKLIAKGTTGTDVEDGDFIIVQTYEKSSEGLKLGDIVKALNVDSDGDIDEFEKADGTKVRISGYLHKSNNDYMGLIGLVEQPEEEKTHKTVYKVMKPVNPTGKTVDGVKAIITASVAEDSLSVGDVVTVLHASSSEDKFDHWKDENGKEHYTAGWVRAKSYKVLEESEVDFTDKINEALKLIEEIESSITRPCKFVISEDERTVVCLQEGNPRQGRAEAAVTDPFIPEIGKAIALCKTVGRIAPDSLTNLMGESEVVPAIGDYVKFIKRENSHNYEVGSIAKIQYYDNGDNTYRATKADGSYGNYFKATCVEMSTEAEFEAQKSQEIKVGMRVKLTTSDPRFGRGEVNVGDIGTVVRIYDTGSETKYKVNFPAQNNWTAVRSDVEIVDGFKEGDRVKLLSGGNSGGLHGFVDGGIYTVVDPNYSESKVKIQNRNVNGYADKDKLELVVGEYVRPTVGDIVEVLNTGSAANCKVGDIVQIVRDDQDDRPYKVKNKNGVTDGFLKEDHVRKVFSSSTEAKPVIAPRLTVGDFAKMKVSKNGIDQGALVKIVRDDEDGEPYKVETVTGAKHSGFMRESDLEAATEEQFNEAVKAATPTTRPTVGSIVKTKVGCDGIVAGTIVRITRDDHDNNPYIVTTLDGSEEASFYRELEVEPPSDSDLMNALVKDNEKLTITVTIKRIDNNDNTILADVGGESNWFDKASLLKAIRD